MSRHFKLRLFLLAAAMLPVFHNAVAGADRYVGRCDVVFKGDSTLDAFAGDITNVPLTVVCGTNLAGETLLSTRIEIGTRQLTTHNTRRDANMYKMFHAESFPAIFVVVSNAPLDAARLAASGVRGSPGTLPAQMTICGITREIRATTCDPESVEAGWEFELDTDLSLKAFKLEPPTMLFGAITVRDIVKVKAHVKLHKEPP